MDPLTCPKFGGPMKIIAFIESHQTEVIEQILRCGRNSPPVEPEVA